MNDIMKKRIEQLAAELATLEPVDSVNAIAMLTAALPPQTSNLYMDALVGTALRAALTNKSLAPVLVDLLEGVGAGIVILMTESGIVIESASNPKAENAERDDKLACYIRAQLHEILKPSPKMTRTVRRHTHGTLLALAVVARCCTGFYVEGVRPSGATRCVKATPATENPGECWGRNACGGHVEAAWYPLAIYCTGGSIPIVVDDRTIGCQARH